VGHDEEDYSDYSRHINTTINGLTLVNGFAFTAITLLLTRLDQPSSLPSQLVLLFLTVLFDLNALVAQHLGVETLYYCRKVPPQTRKVAVRTAFMFLAFVLFGLGIPLMFFLFDLVYLSIGAAVVWLFVVLADLIFIYRPLQEYRKKHVG
jgi:hypothetical protein